jgi:hypothetical protein
MLPVLRNVKAGYGHGFILPYELRMKKNFRTGFRAYLDIRKSKTRTETITHSRSRALLDEPPIEHPLKNFPAFYGTRRLNTVFTRALYWSLS